MWWKPYKSFRENTLYLLLKNTHTHTHTEWRLGLRGWSLWWSNTSAITHRKGLQICDISPISYPLNPNALEGSVPKLSHTHTSHTHTHTQNSHIWCGTERPRLVPASRRPLKSFKSFWHDSFQRFEFKDKCANICHMDPQTDCYLHCLAIPCHDVNLSICLADGWADLNAQVLMLTPESVC